MRAALARHDALRTWVAQWGLTDESPLPNVPRRCVASLSTHDTPTFTAWWTGPTVPVAVRATLGTPDVAQALRALAEALGATDAEIVLLALDDLWGATAAQNVPGTGPETPNWRRRHARSLTDLEHSTDLAPLEHLARARVRASGR